MTRITFLMPTFNRAHFIAESIHSITSQMNVDDELIVINDGSTDHTLEVLGGMDEQFKVLTQDNAGKSVALNRGMAEARGDYIWICDDDDLLCEGAVGKLVDLIERSGAGFVFGRYTRFSIVDGEKVDQGTGYWPDLSKGSLARHIFEDSFVMHNASLVRRSVYEAVGPFDETMLRSLDYDMFVRLALKTTIAHTGDILFEQRKHDGARGPASVLHAASKSDNVWKEFDRRIFARLRDAAPVSYFEGLFESPKPELIMRAAYLQRGTIMGRHDLWDEAAQDWQLAETVCDLPLQELEKDICRRAMAGKHGFSGALAQPVLAALHDLKNRGETGRAIAHAMLDGLIWRLRDADPATRREARRMITELDGVFGIAKVAGRRMPALVSQRSDDRLREKSDPPPLD